MTIRRRFRQQAEIPNSSMSDIAFLLLIFFMVTTAFAVRKGIKFRQPMGTEGETVDVPAVSIEVLETGAILINEVPASVEDIERFIRPDLVLNPQTPVLVIVHAKANYGNMVDVLDELKGMGVQNIVLPSREEIESWS